MARSAVTRTVAMSPQRTLTLEITKTCNMKNGLAPRSAQIEFHPGRLRGGERTAPLHQHQVAVQVQERAGAGTVVRQHS